jgi:hypothetical protein
MKQRPGLDQDVIRGDQWTTRLEDRFGASIAAIGRICRGIPDRRVNE